MAAVQAAIPAGLNAADERHHRPGSGRLWSEAWYFDFVTRDGSLGGYVRFGLYPNLRACWYWACVVGEGRRLVTVVDHDVTPPRQQSLELRGEGLWADHTVEVAYEHMTLGCEAFALGLDEPAAVYGPGPPLGERVPFGLDLEWETDGHVYPYPGGVTRYEVPCRVHGEVLVGDERIQLDAVGQRDHSWGERDWWTLSWTWTAGWLEDGTRFHGSALRYGDDVLAYFPGYVQAPGGEIASGGRTAATAELGAAGVPTAATFTLGELDLEIEPVAVAPVLLASPDGRTSRLPRALCRFHDRATGRRGVGWTEWNQPQYP
jgi:hypothetical protein